MNHRLALLTIPNIKLGMRKKRGPPVPYFVDTKYDRAMKNERTKAVAIERSIFTLDRNVSAGVILKPSVSLDRILCTNSIKFSCNLANSNYLVFL